MRCQIAVLAGGRVGGGAGLARRRKYLDNNVGIAAVLSNSSFSTPVDETLLEAIPSGWFYFATLPGGSAVAVFVTLAKFIPPAGEGRLRWWLSALATTRMVREALSGYRLPRTVTVLDTRTSYADPCAGEDWFAIGDARLAHDPLSGRSLILSIHDACNAVDAMSRGYSDGIAAQLRIQTRSDLRLYLHERYRSIGLRIDSSVIRFGSKISEASNKIPNTTWK
jgi:2-polyprenyl-6-methoxyphenol hydroxylase-like FAD-dependent oxidoreductase